MKATVRIDKALDTSATLGGGGNPNSVQVINGTLADPWGEGFDGVDFADNLADNNITAYIDITYGGQTNRAYFYAFVGYIIAGQAIVDTTLTDVDAFMLSYAVGQTPDLRAANLLHAGNILILSDEADNIPTTLTIIWHPMPTP